MLGDALVSDERVRMVSFTGGLEAGKHITTKAGLKKIGMELGSNSPVVVWKDADIEWAAETCVSGAFWAAGQNCIGVQRIYIHREVYDRFRDRFVELTNGYTIGDKMDEATDMGPMITEAEAERVERWINEAVDKGATIAAGGEPHGHPGRAHRARERPGRRHHPLRRGLRPDGQPLPLRRSRRRHRRRPTRPTTGSTPPVSPATCEICFRLIEGLDAGSVLINDSTDYRLDSMPFGGVKGSGLGQEGVKFSLQEMTEPKVVCWYLPGLR